jgi:hypothetical protein
MQEFDPTRLDDAHLQAHAEYAKKMSEYWQAVAARDLAELALRGVMSEHYPDDIAGSS